VSEPTTEAGRRLAGELQVKYRIDLICAIEAEARAIERESLRDILAQVEFGFSSEERSQRGYIRLWSVVMALFEPEARA
jgi:hypothetical protein